MKLFRKVKNLLFSNVNDVVDKCNNAEKMLKYSIVKMESALEKGNSGLVEMMVSKKILEKNRQKTIEKIEALKSEIKQNINDEQKSLSLIKHKQDLGKVLKEYDNQIEKQNRYIERMKQQISTVKLNIETAKNKKDVLLARKTIAETRNIVFKDLKIDEELFNDAEEKIETKEIYADVMEENYVEVNPVYNEAVMAEYESLRGK